MELSNQNKLNSDIASYYVYTVIEMLAVMGVSLLQLKLVEKLLNSGTIV